MSEPYWVALGPKATPVDYVGDWAAGTPYLPGQVVRRNGADHIAVNPSTGQEPSGQVGALPVIGMGTSLPDTPYDGQEYILTDSLTVPTYSWRFRYVAAKASNKWVFVGGAPALASVGTMESVGGGSVWKDVATVGPQITVPVTGEYIVDCSLQVGLGANFPETCTFGVSDNGATNPAVSAATEGSRANCQTTGSVSDRRTLTAGSVPRMRYLAYQTTTSVGRRIFQLTPVAVGG